MHNPDAPHGGPGRLRGWELALLGLALLLFAGQALLASPQKSAAFDEQYHLSTGYAYLRTGDFRLATDHPLLMGALAGLALLPRRDVVLPLEDPSWQAGDFFIFSDRFLWEVNADPQGLLVAARVPVVAVGLLLVVALFLWARELTGEWGGWLALALATFDPNLVANSRLVTTDLGITAFLFLAGWRLWAWLERRRRRDLLATGLWAGLAMGAKYNSLLFWPVALVAILLYPPRDRQDAPASRLGALAAMGLVAWGVLWALYRFDFGPIPGLTGSIPVPAAFYWQQLWDTYRGIVDPGEIHYRFLLGQTSTQGWVAYFPVALAVKTPLPLLLTAAVGIYCLARRPRWRRLGILWLLPGAFMALGMTGVLTIGYRHILPAIPYLILLAGHSAQLPGLHPRLRPWMPYLGGLMLLWVVLGQARIYPHQEAYFNELAGGWQNWSHILVDSNLDWGQDLPALRQVMDELGIETVNLAYFGKAVPEAYGVQYRPLPGYLRFVQGEELKAYNPYTPAPGWYAISATSLRLGLTLPGTVDLYAYFRKLTPVARAGYSIYLYQVSYPPETPVDRVVLTGEAASDLSPTALGLQPGRRVQVKWRRSDEATIYPLGEGFRPPAGPGFQPVNANFSDVFTLLGYQLETPSARPGEDVAMTLVWQVGSRPMPMPAPTRGVPLSSFVHLTGTDPAQIVAQFDGWRTALRGLEPGDIIAHRLTLHLEGDISPGSYLLRVGLYSPQSGERLRLQGDAGGGDHVLLGSLEVLP